MLPPERMTPKREIRPRSCHLRSIASDFSYSVKEPRKPLQRHLVHKIPGDPIAASQFADNAKGCFTFPRPVTIPAVISQGRHHDRWEDV
jgi:hypothetical protein